MKLRGIEFGPAWAASGAQGFFGEGYWWHKFVPGLDWEGATFVSKTTTLEGRLGNMPLKADWSPKGLFPDCVRVRFLQGAALNAVGLSGPGAKALLDTGRWQARTEPFLLSFMSVAGTKRERFREAEKFCELLSLRIHEFQAPVALQVNLSCPNAGHDPSALAFEASEFVRCFRDWLPIPIVAKINVLFPIKEAMYLPVDALCVSNTIPWGSCCESIGWNALFQSAHSPLEHLGGGGLSGAPLLPLVAEWVKSARAHGMKQRINAGGGILGPNDVDVLAAAGPDSVSLGTIAMLRDWRLRRTIRRARKVFA